MKKNLLLGVLLFAIFSQVSKAQENGVQSGAISLLVVKANNLFHLSKMPLRNYYSLGGEAGVYFKDKIYIGLSQYSSLAPSDVWSKNAYNPDKISVYEYSIRGGYKFNFKSPLYIYAGLLCGYGALNMEYRYNNGVDFDETMTREQLGTIFGAPDLKMGIKLYKFISLEAGLNYRYCFGGKDKWGLTPSHMNGLGGTISLVGHLPR